MRRLVCASAAIAALILPSFAPAQVTSVFGRTGAVTSQTGDYSISQISGAGTAAQKNTGTSGANVPVLNTTNTWGAYQVGCWNSLGCVSPKEGVVFNAIGPLTGENDLFDGVSYNGFSQYQAERYDYSGGSWVGVGANEVVGAYLGAARTSTGSDPSDAGIVLFTTEAQTSTHNGMGLELDYTANGSIALARGLSVSPQGNGGVTIGGGYASNNPYSYAAPTDLGPGTLHASDSIVTANHFRSDGSKPTLSSCGTSPTITGTDVAGFVSNGGAVSSCTVTFAKAYASTPVCVVQTFANAAPVAYVTSYSPSYLTVSWNSTLNGSWYYICQGVS